MSRSGCFEELEHKGAKICSKYLLQTIYIYDIIFMGTCNTYDDFNHCNDFIDLY